MKEIDWIKWVCKEPNAELKAKLTNNYWVGYHYFRSDISNNKVQKLNYNCWAFMDIKPESYLDYTEKYQDWRVWDEITLF